MTNSFKTIFYLNLHEHAQYRRKNTRVTIDYNANIVVYNIQHLCKIIKIDMHQKIFLVVFHKIVLHVSDSRQTLPRYNFSI